MKRTFVVYLAAFLGLATLRTGVPIMVSAQSSVENIGESELQTAADYQRDNTLEYISPVVYVQEEDDEDEEDEVIEAGQLPVDPKKNIQFNSTYWNEDPHRIVGGQPISIQQAPWQVVVYVNGFFNCGGCVISSKWVLTAAHCIGNARYVVRVGSRFRNRGGEGRSIRLIVVHGEYNQRTYENDIAMLLVSRRFNFGTNVLPIPLATTFMKLPAQYTVSGWGRLRSGGPIPVGLRAVTVKSVSNRQCKALYKGLLPINPRQLCAASPGKDACQGDSGGPLVSRGKLFGIVSSGIGCAERRFPGVYTDVRQYKYWIKKVAFRYSLF